MMKSYSILLGDRKMHFKEMGSGPPILLLHASPLSSNFLIPFIQALAPHFTVIAPDTPGYGNSELLSKTPSSLDDYIDNFNLFLMELGIKSCSVYGTATGAQLGIRYALMCPEKIDHLYLDNIAHFTPAEREEILHNYFPDFSPKADGSHLDSIWQVILSMFEYFPWCFPRDENKIHTAKPPLAAYHSIMIEYLRAGKHYDIAYRLAFKHEDINNLKAVKTATSFFHWEGSILGPYMQRIREATLPENIHIIPIPRDTKDRYGIMAKYMQSHANAVSSTLNIHTAKLQEDVQQNLVESIPNHSFPEAQLDGNYWRNAWNALPDFGNLEDKTAALISWAKK